MTKIFNKLFYYIKNLILPFLMFATIYIVVMMFQRLGKEPFGANFFEFFEVIIPYILLIILLLVNTFLHQDEVRNSLFYNLTSFLVMLTIFVFCYRALFDKNLILWHKLKYDIDFNYFTDQIAPMKTLLYLLSAANVILIIKGYIKVDDDIKETQVIEPKEEIKDNFKVEEVKEDNFKVLTEEEDFSLPKEDEDINISLDIKKDNNTNNNNNNQHKNNKNYYYNNNKNKKNNYYKNNKNNYYKNNKPKQNNNNQNKPKKSFDFYE